MIKVITWFRRQPDLPLEEFRRYWRQEHPKAVLQLPGLRKYVQNHVLDSQYSRQQPYADGIAETWWDSREALAQQRGSEELAALMVDEDKFINPEGRVSMAVEEVVVVNGGIPVDALKVIVWVQRRPDVGFEAAQTHWRTAHAALAAQIPGLRRYVQNHGRSGRSEPPVLGLPMTWFADIETMRANADSAELAATRADEPNFLTDHIPFVVVTEHHII